MTDAEYTRINRVQYQLIKQLSADEQGRAVMALLDNVFQNENQNDIQFEIQNENQIEFFTDLAKSIISMIAPQLKMRQNRAGGARIGAGRPRKSGNVPKMHMPENIGQLDNSKNQNENQNDIQFEIQNENQIEKNNADARVSDNIKNNNIIISPKETIPLSGDSTEKSPCVGDKWVKFLAEWNRIAAAYKRPRCRAITPALKKSVVTRCKENKLCLSDFLITCDKALAGDKSLRCGTDTWRGADLVYFSRTANFTRALQIADNPAAGNQDNATAQALREFIKGEQ